MKSLTNFINESISKKEILSQAKEVNDLTSILLDLGFKKTRVTKWNRMVKKILGTNKSLYVASTYGNEKSNIDALKSIISKGQVRRNTNSYAPDGDYFELSGIDYGESNAKHKHLWDPKQWSSKSPEELADMFKNNMKYDLARNEYIKKVGITDEVKKKIEEICKTCAKEFAEDNVGLFVKSNEGDYTNLIPSLFIVGNDIVKAVVFGWDHVYQSERYTEKMKGNFIIVFSKEDIDNLEDEAK